MLILDAASTSGNKLSSTKKDLDNKNFWIQVRTNTPAKKVKIELETGMSIKKAKVEVIFCEESYIETVRKIIDRGETSLKEVISMDETEGTKTVKGLIKKGEELIKKRR